MQTIDFYYDFGSSNAYLVHKVLPGLAAKHGAKVVWQPMLLGGVFKATNNRSPLEAFGEVTNKLGYMRLENRRFIARHSLEFNSNPHFPVITLGVMRGAIYVQGKDIEETYRDTVFDAMWVDGKKMDDPEVIAEVLEQAGLPAGEIMNATQDQDIKSQLIEATGKAVDRGIFGSPTMFVGDEMFFGKDSLHDLEYLLDASTRGG